MLVACVHADSNETMSNETDSVEDVMTTMIPTFPDNGTQTLIAPSLLIFASLLLMLARM